MGQTNQASSKRDADLVRAEAFGFRDLRMVMEDLAERGLPDAAVDFPWPVLLHDGERITYVNPACLRWLDCHGDGALLGQPLSVLCRAEDERALLAALGAGPHAPPPSPHLQRFCNRAGEVLLGHALARRQALEGSPSTCALIAPSTASERSFELLQLLGEAVDHLTDIVFITEAHAIDGVGRRVVFVNRAFTASSGYEPHEVLGKTPNVTVGEGTDRAVLARLEAALAATQPVREDLLKYGKDGTPYWVELQIIPMFDGAGEHTHWISIQRDISERKRLEARLLESARLASAGELSASLASELNSPLASVVSSLEWLAERLPSLLGQHGDLANPELKETLEALDDARQSARRLAAVTNYLQLLSASSSPAGHALPLGPALETARTEAERQLGRSLAVSLAADTSLRVLADPARLDHALRLVLFNAGLSSDGGSILVETQIKSASQLTLCVDDTGVGIHPEMAGTLGAPFETRKPPGIGDALALFVASRLVAEMGGELVLTPRPRGTRVELRLPRPL